MTLVDQLARDYPALHFVRGQRAYWSAREQTIYYTDDWTQTLHELGHALLGHSHYGQDIELLQMERAAWELAQQLAPRYHLTISDNTVEDTLDSYRDWLHCRSKCPTCGQTGIQSKANLTYHCPNCHCRWSVNDGRSQRIKRTKIK